MELPQQIYDRKKYHKEKIRRQQSVFIFRGVVMQSEYFKDMRNKLVDYIEMIEEANGLELNKVKFAERLGIKTGRKIDVNFVKNLLRRSNDSGIDVQIWTATCSLLGVNPVDILPKGWRDNRPNSPKSEEDKAIWRRIHPERPDWMPVPPDFYDGTYDAYFFRPLYMMEKAMAGVSETESQTLLHAKLTLKYEKGTTRAILKEDETETRYDGDKKTRSLTLTGEAKVLLKTNQVYIELEDTEALRHMVLMWPYIELAKDVLYSQVAAVLTTASQQYKHPLFEKMVLFRRDPMDTRVNKTFDDRIIRGILSMNNGKLLVEEAKLATLVKEIPNISKFMKYRKVYYEMSQLSMLESYDMIEGMSYTDCMECIMKLRNISYSPAVYTVEEHERFNVYSKMLQRGGEKIPGLSNATEVHDGDEIQE